MDTSGTPHGRRHIVGGVLVALLLAVSQPLAAGAQPTPPGPERGKPATGRLSSRLAALADPGRESLAAIPDNHPGGTRRLGDGRVLVDVRVDDNGATMQHRLEAVGGQVVAVGDPALRTITVAVDDRHLRAVSEVAGVENVKEVLTPIRNGCTPIISEGDTQLKAAATRALYGADGTGVTVGIVSDSFNRFPLGAATDAGQDVAAGDLPGSGNPCGRTTAVNVVADNSTQENLDEGRAMAQIVHDLAPGASLAFATGTLGESATAGNINSLVSAGADVLVDDLTYYTEPFYQDGPIAVALNQARAAGVTVFTSAGNGHKVVAGKPVGSYESLSWRGTTCPPLPATFIDCFNFSPSGGTDNTHRMTVPAGATLALNVQWAQPRGGVTTDFDVCMLDSGTGSPVACGGDFNTGPTGTQMPFEGFGFTNDLETPRTVDVVVGRFSGPPVRFKWIHAGGTPSSVEYSTATATDVFGSTIWGHSGAASALSVAAVPYHDSTVPESFSSHGPVTVLFNPVPATTALATPQVLSKPDMAASDCGQNSFYPPGPFTFPPYRFCGTSAAAPHAAGVAALLLDAAPTTSPAQVESTLEATADPVGTAPATVVGAGLIDAQAAMVALAGSPPADGDYNGDGTTEIAVFRPSNGVWFVNGGAATAWGINGDIPVPGDYNGNGTTDVAVFRPSNGVWFVNGGAATTWGTNGDRPLPLPSAIRQAFFP